MQSTDQTWCSQFVWSLLFVGIQEFFLGHPSKIVPTLGETGSDAYLYHLVNGHLFCSPEFMGPLIDSRSWNVVDLLMLTMLESPKKFYILQDAIDLPDWFQFFRRNMRKHWRADRPARLSDLLISEEHVFKLPREPGTCQIVGPVRKAGVLQQKTRFLKRTFFYLPDVSSFFALAPSYPLESTRNHLSFLTSLLLSSWFRN